MRLTCPKCGEVLEVSAGRGLSEMIITCHGKAAPHLMEDGPPRKFETNIVGINNRKRVIGT